MLCEGNGGLSKAVFLTTKEDRFYLGVEALCPTGRSFGSEPPCISSTRFHAPQLSAPLLGLCRGRLGRGVRVERKHFSAGSTARGHRFPQPWVTIISV